MIEKQDYYELLGVARDATLAEIKIAFRQKAQKYHPDLNQHDAKTEQKFKEVNRAYNVLRDTEKRAIYDQFGAEGLAGENGFGSDPFSSFAGGFDDIFAEFFGGGPAGHRRRTQQTFQQTVELSLAEAYSGKSVEVKLPEVEPCKDCDGSGAHQGKTFTCNRCDGHGYTEIRHSFLNIRQTCSACRGTGKRTDSVCSSCQGSGVHTTYKMKQINIPAGIDDNVVLKIATPNVLGEGYLHLHVRVKPHETFQRRGNDLLCSLEIGMIEACLGGTKTITGLDENPITVTIPELCQYGDVITLKNEGMPIINRKNKRGKLLIQLKVILPEHLSKKQKEQLKIFSDLNN